MSGSNVLPVVKNMVPKIRPAIVARSMYTKVYAWKRPNTSDEIMSAATLDRPDAESAASKQARKSSSSPRATQAQKKVTSIMERVAKICRKR